MYLSERKIKQILVIDFYEIISGKGNLFMENLENFLRRYNGELQSYLPDVFQSTLLVISNVKTSEYETKDLYELVQEFTEMPTASK